MGGEKFAALATDFVFSLLAVEDVALWIEIEGWVEPGEGVLFGRFGVEAFDAEE